MDRFQLCFICRFPTTDWSPNESGEPICGMCWAEEAEDKARWAVEKEAVYYALGEHWEEDMREMLAS